MQVLYDKHDAVSNHDTQSTQSYCLYRLREEIESVIEDKRELCADDLDKLHYMEQVWIHKTI